MITREYEHTLLIHILYFVRVQFNSDNITLLSAIVISHYAATIYLNIINCETRNIKVTTPGRIDVVFFELVLIFFKYIFKYFS